MSAERGRINLLRDNVPDILSNCSALNIQEAIKILNRKILCVCVCVIIVKEGLIWKRIGGHGRSWNGGVVGRNDVKTVLKYEILKKVSHDLRCKGCHIIAFPIL